jgi:hypothetical protein
VQLANQLTNKSPDKVISMVFAPGNLSTTHTYKAMTDTQTYDQVVKAWMDQFLRDASTMTGDQIYKRLKPLAREDAQGMSQLRLMLEQYPDALRTVEQALTTYEALPTRMRAASESVQRAREGARQARERAGLEGKGIESAHGYMHAMPGIFMRVGVPLASALGALEMAQRGHPVWAGATVAGAAGITAFNWWVNNTAAGRRAIRQGFPTPYGPAAVRTGVQAGAQPPVPVPPSAPFTPGAVGAPVTRQGGANR